MTEIYQYYSWPKKVDVVCPSCERLCSFKVKNQVVNRRFRDGQSALHIYTDKWSGKISCLGCGLVKEGEIKWPNDAYFKVDVRGSILWAWTKEHAIEIRDYLDARIRENRSEAYLTYLCHIPTHFKRRGNRSYAVNGLNAVIRNAAMCK